MAAPFKDLWGPGLGKVNITTHRLHLEEGARPSYAQPYRATGFKRQVIEQVSLNRVRGSSTPH